MSFIDILFVTIFSAFSHRFKKIDVSELNIPTPKDFVKVVKKEVKKNKKGKEQTIEIEETVNRFPDSGYVLANKKGNIYSFEIPGYIHWSKISSFTHTEYWQFGYLNEVDVDDDGNIIEDDKDIYHFFLKIKQLCYNWCKSNDELLSKNFVMKTYVSNPEKDYYYCPVYPTKEVMDNYADYISTDGIYNCKISVMLIKHGNFYIPMFILTDISPQK